MAGKEPSIMDTRRGSGIDVGEPAGDQPCAQRSDAGGGDDSGSIASAAAAQDANAARADSMGSESAVDGEGEPESEYHAAGDDGSEAEDGGELAASDHDVYSWDDETEAVAPSELLADSSKARSDASDGDERSVDVFGSNLLDAITGSVSGSLVSEYADGSEHEQQPDLEKPIGRLLSTGLGPAPSKLWPRTPGGYVRCAADYVISGDGGVGGGEVRPGDCSASVSPAFSHSLCAWPGMGMQFFCLQLLV